MKEERTAVVFRKFKDDGEIIAIFPEIPGGYDQWSCAMYVHNGQHGTCHPHAVMHNTNPCHPTECASLKRELEGEPYNYNLKVHHRITATMDNKRRKELERE